MEGEKRGKAESTATPPPPTSLFFSLLLPAFIHWCGTLDRQQGYRNQGVRGKFCIELNFECSLTIKMHMYGSQKHANQAMHTCECIYTHTHTHTHTPFHVCSHGTVCP